MKLLTASRTLDIPAGVTVEIKARKVRVKGPRGTLQKDFKHLDVDAYLVSLSCYINGSSRSALANDGFTELPPQGENEEGKPALKVDVWFGKRATLAAIRTLCSHVQNMIGARPRPPVSRPHSMT